MPTLLPSFSNEDNTNVKLIMNTNSSQRLEPILSILKNKSDVSWCKMLMDNNEEHKPHKIMRNRKTTAEIKRFKRRLLKFRTLSFIQSHRR